MDFSYLMNKNIDFLTDTLPGTPEREDFLKEKGRRYAEFLELPPPVREMSFEEYCAEFLRALDDPSSPRLVLAQGFSAAKVPQLVSSPDWVDSVRWWVVQAAWTMKSRCSPSQLNI